MIKTSEDDLKQLDRADLIGMLWSTQEHVTQLEFTLLAVRLAAKTLATKVAKDYPDAADWKDAIGELQTLANTTLKEIGEI